MERVIVDRFEGNVAVVEAGLGHMRNVPQSQLPPGIFHASCGVPATLFRQHSGIGVERRRPVEKHSRQDLVGACFSRK